MTLAEADRLAQFILQTIVGAGTMVLTWTFMDGVKRLLGLGPALVVAVLLVAILLIF